jgi:predicted glycosyltransferase
VVLDRQGREARPRSGLRAPAVLLLRAQPRSRYNSAGVKVWIDIDNPPQVQYLIPFKAAFERAGVEVLITARDLAITHELLRGRGVEFQAVGKGFGGARAAKAFGTVRRARQLAQAIAGDERPDLLIAGSRASAFTARFKRIPIFAFCDYEYSELTSARFTRTHILHPDVIERSVFTNVGLRNDRLIPFPGIKEDISFTGVDLAAVRPHSFPELPDHERPRVLFRPPSESTHYYKEESKGLAIGLVERLAARSDVVVVFSPRYPEQTAAYLDPFQWACEPVRLAEAVPFVSLMKAVDAVVSSGGTMLREAAYLGIPAYSILRSEIGRVDRHLESIGRLRVITAPDEFDVPQVRRGPLDPIPPRSTSIVDDLVRTMLDRIS